MRQTVGQRRHLKLKNHQNISSVCPWCVDCVSNLRLVSACQTFPTPPCTTRRARSASTSPSEPGGMDEMDEIWHVSLWLSTRSAFGRYHQIFIRSHIGSYRISSDQNIDFLSIDVPIIFESFIEILRSQKKTTCCLDDLQRRQHQIRIAMFELRKYVGISSLTRRWYMTRDLPSCYDLWVITAHAWYRLVV